MVVLLGGRVPWRDFLYGRILRHSGVRCPARKSPVARIEGVYARLRRVMQYATSGLRQRRKTGGVRNARRCAGRQRKVAKFVSLTAYFGVNSSSVGSFWPKGWLC